MEAQREERRLDCKHTFPPVLGLKPARLKLSEAGSRRIKFLFGWIGSQCLPGWSVTGLGSPLLYRTEKTEQPPQASKVRSGYHWECGLAVSREAASVASKLSDPDQGQIIIPDLGMPVPTRAEERPGQQEGPQSHMETKQTLH